MNAIPSPLPKTTDAWIEHDIKRVGADKAPRVTPADIEANIASEHYFTAGQAFYGAMYLDRGLPDMSHLQTGSPLSLLTFCVLVLRNGFTVTGESACASPENFNAEIGKKIARENAVQKIWPLMGYALRSELSKTGE